MPLQAWIHHWQEGAGARLLKAMAAVLAFVFLAAFYDLVNNGTFASEEAMETAQLARNISEGKGYTTDSIRPVALYFLQTAAEPGQSSKVLAEATPDLNVAPGYPVLLAGLMKIAPFHFEAKDYWSYPPERWITAFNQFLLFAAVVLLYFLARSLFDIRVAWMSVILFLGTDLIWQFSASGLSTVLLIGLFLGLAACLVAMDRRDRALDGGSGWPLMTPAILAGALLGLGTLTRYSFGFLAVPTLLFVIGCVRHGRGKLSVAVAVVFLLVIAPWLARNFMASGHVFGAAQYALVQGTTPFPADVFERSTDPTNGLRRVVPAEIIGKFLANARDICADDLPKLAGNWVSAFFLAGLLIPFRNRGLMRLRWFLAGSILLFVIVEAFTRTHLSSDVPRVNSENLLVIFAPLIVMFGAALFYTLLDQLNLAPLEGAGVIVVLFAGALCSPFALALLAPRLPPVDSPYSPLHLRQMAGLMNTNECLMSDIPGGVAWYGQRPCVWLPLDDQEEFFVVKALKPVHALFLTQETMNKRYLSDMKEDARSWGQFVLACAEHGEVPAGFPFRKAPAGLLPQQLFLSDKARWRQFKPGP